MITTTVHLYSIKEEHRKLFTGSHPTYGEQRFSRTLGKRISLHKKRSFLSRISSVNVTKSAVFRSGDKSVRFP